MVADCNDKIIKRCKMMQGNAKITINITKGQKLREKVDDGVHFSDVNLGILFIDPNKLYYSFHNNFTFSHCKL